MPSSLRLAGIILCGGRSTRMGQPKAWLPLGNETMLPRIVRLVRPFVDPVIVVAAEGQSLPALPDEVTILRDSIPQRGPLQAIADGLAHLAGRVEAAFVSSCDAPLLVPELIPRLADLLGDRLICVPKVADRCHPLAAIYRIEVADQIAAMLAQDRLRVMDLFAVVATRIVTPAEIADVDPALQSFRNLNTPEDYSAVQSFLSLTQA